MNHFLLAFCFAFLGSSSYAQFLNIQLVDEVENMNGISALTPVADKLERPFLYVAVQTHRFVKE